MAGLFVGRSSETTALHRLCREAFRDGVPAVGVVIGDAGSGKSRLLAEVRSLISVGEQISMAGYEPERAVPLAAAGTLLQRLRAGLGSEAVDALAFGPRRDTTPVEPVRLFEAAHRALADMGPTVVVFDDLHWADDMSLALLHYIVRAAATSREPSVVLAASRRSAAVTRLTASLGRVLDVDRQLEIDLAPLGREDGVRLARQLAPHLDERQGGNLWQMAGGSPFWLKVLSASEHLDMDVDRVLTDRLRQAGVDAAALLAMLAIIGRPVPVEDVAEIQGWVGERVDREAATLERIGLAAQDAGSLSVAHELIRDAALRSIPADRSRRIHRRVGTWLQASAGDDEPLLLEALEHQHDGGDSALALAVRLVRSSRRRLLGTTGFERLAAVADESDPSEVDALTLREGVASMAMELGQHEQALRRWSECSDLHREPVASAFADLRASEAALELVRHREAWRHLERARRHAHWDPVLDVETLAQEAALHKFLEHRPDETRAAAHRALSAARALGTITGATERQDERERRALLRALFVAAESALFFGDPEEMLALAEELSAAAVGVDDDIYIRALVEGAVALRFLGLNVDAESRLRQAWDAARRKVLPQRILEVGAALGNVLLSMGRLKEAESVTRECLALGTRLEEFRPSRAFAVVLPHLIELSRGDWHRAVEGLRASTAAEPDPHYRQHAHRERATALARLEPHDAADEVREAVAAALADAETAACRRCSAEALARSAEALARIGDPAAARRLITRACIEPADAHNRFWHQRAEAAIMAASDDPAGTAVALLAVIAEAERQSLHLESLWARIDLGAALAGFDRGGAVDVLRGAGAAAEEMGATTAQRMVEQALRALGVRTWRRGAATSRGDQWATLTAREREIALLIGKGSTNPEIAAAVFLSRKTVERHVSNIFAKLGLRNRAELAALIHDGVESRPLGG